MARYVQGFGWDGRATGRMPESERRRTPEDGGMARRSLAEVGRAFDELLGHVSEAQSLIETEQGDREQTLEDGDEWLPDGEGAMAELECALDVASRLFRGKPYLFTAR